MIKLNREHSKSEPLKSDIAFQYLYIFLNYRVVNSLLIFEMWVGYGEVLVKGCLELLRLTF